MKQIFFTLLLTVLCVPASALAADFRAEEQISFTQADPIEDDLYFFGGNINTTTNVVGDLMTAGGNVLINGAISGDLLTAGGTVTITTDVNDDIRAAGGNLTITSRVGGDVVLVGGQTQISGEGIGGDLIWGGGTLQLSAPVAGNLKLGGGEVVINGPVGGNIEFWGDKLTLGSNAVVDGTIFYKSRNEATVMEGAVVRGEITYELVTQKEKQDRGLLGVSIAGVVMGILTWLVAGLFIGLTFRRFATTVTNQALTHPLKELGRGFLALVALPIASIILMVTVIGLPVGILGLVAFIGFIVISLILAPIILGSWLYKLIAKRDTYEVTWKSILLGVIVSALLNIIPVVGWLVNTVFVLFAAGAIVKTKMAVAKEWC